MTQEEIKLLLISIFQMPVKPELNVIYYYFPKDQLRKCTLACLSDDRLPTD